MTRMLATVALALAAAACGPAPGDQPPRRFMEGGVWYPSATGYWFHQYATQDDIERLMADLGFACTEGAGDEAIHLRCERGFRVPGLLRRTDYAEFAVRRNGAIALARSGCRFAFLGSERLGGSCTPFAAKGAVYPGVEAFAAMTEAMLRPMPAGRPISIFRLPPKDAGAAPRDAEALVDQLGQWRFECEPPQHRFTTTFRGNVGEVLEATCQQWSLRAPGVVPQSQQLVVRYDSLDLAVLGVTVRLDGKEAALSPALRTPRPAEVGATAPTLTLATIAGERIAMPQGAIGTGSRQQTREGFLTLTPESQRALVHAYLDKQAKAWGTPPERLSQAYLGTLEWYGPDALPHLDALASDDRPALGAAILRYRCLDAGLSGTLPVGDAEATAMAACIDVRRATLPRSLAMLDHLLANELHTLAGMETRGLNAFFDFWRDTAFVVALGPDGKESIAALDAVTNGKAGLDPRLAKLVDHALARRHTAVTPR